MSRLVDVPPQRVYGSVPLQLPLIKMSDAEKIWLNGQPQLYDKDYPLYHDGLNFDPPWWADTGVGGGLSGVGGGNVRLMPWEKENGFGSLGLTKAQTAAQARQAAIAAAKASGDKAAAAAKAGAKAAIAARQSYVAPPKVAPIPSTPAPIPVPVQVASGSTLTRGQTNRQAACIKKGGTFDLSTLRCVLPIKAKPLTAAQKRAQAACLATTPPGTYANGVCTPAAGSSAATDPAAACAAMSPPGTYANGVCTPASSSGFKDCQPGYYFDSISGSCLVSSGTGGGTTQTPAQLCAAQGGVFDGTYCNAPGSSQNNQAAIQQCQSSGGYWNGTYCVPSQNQFSTGGGSGGGGTPGTSPIPPGFDSGSGDPYGGGGGSGMTSGGGPGPQLNDQASNIPTGDGSGNYDPTTDPSQTGDQSSDDDDGNSGDSSKVATSNVFESIAKLFSGMGGMACGCDAPTPWFGMGGTNLPPMQMRKPVAKPVENSHAGLIGIAVVAAAGAAIYLYSKRKKK